MAPDQEEGEDAMAGDEGIMFGDEGGIIFGEGGEDEMVEMGIEGGEDV